MTPTQAQIKAAAKAAWEIYKGYPWPKNQEQWEKAIAAAITAAVEVGEKEITSVDVALAVESAGVNHMAGSKLIVVKAGYDTEADVWFIESSDLPGLSAEAPTLEALTQRLPGMAQDLIEANGPGLPNGNIVCPLCGQVGSPPNCTGCETDRRPHRSRK